MTLLGLRQLQIQLFKFGLSRLLLLFKRRSLALQFTRFCCQLALALSDLLGLLLKTQHIHIQSMRFGLGFGGLLSQLAALASGLASSRLGSRQM